MNAYKMTVGCPSSTHRTRAKVCNYKKLPRVCFFFNYGNDQFNKATPASVYEYCGFYLFEEHLLRTRESL